MKEPIQNRLRYVICLLFALLSVRASAAVWYWDPNGLSAPTSGTWDTNVAQWATTSALTATPSVWNPASAAGFPAGVGNISALAITVDQSIGFAGIFNGLNAGAGITNLTFIGSGNISLNAGAQGFWNGQSYYNTIIRIPIIGPGGVQNQSSGSLFLSGNNSYSGGTFLATSAGLNFNNDNSFGTGFITNNVATTVLATPATDSSGTAFATGPITLANLMKTFGGTGTTILVGNNSVPINFTGGWSLIGAAGTTATFDQRTSTVTISGVMSGAANFAKTGNGTTILSGANTYSGQTIVRNGVLSVNSLNNVTGGVATSALGHPTTVANGTITLGATTTTGTLKYTGAGETSDRVINLGGTTGGGILQSDGTGALILTSANTATGVGIKNLTLQGTSTAANTIAGKIVDSSAGATAVVKAQAGTWKLTGTNTYTGGTTISAGTLEIGPTGSIVGNVTNTAGVLQLDSTTNLASSAAISTSTALPSGSINLNFTGNQVINALVLDNGLAASGTWGSPTSGAQNTNPIFTGTGKLNVLGAPVILQQPQSIASYPDALNRSFSVTVAGDPSFTYHWKLNGNDIGGATDSTYTIPIVEAANAGTYVCAITNNFGFTNTAPATLTVLATNTYVNTILADGPISYWRLGETNGTLAQDGVGGNIGKYVNVALNQPGFSVVDTDAAIGVPAAAGRGFVQVTNFSPFTFQFAPTFTLEAWVNFTNVSGVQRIFSTFAGASPSWGYAFGINGGNQLRFTTSTVQDADQSLANALTPGLWYHLVLSCDGSLYHFYVNGNEVGTGVGVIGGGNTGVNVPLQIGANPATYPTAEQVNGLIDEAAIYNTFLSQPQVQAHYNARYDIIPPIVSAPVASPATNYVSLSSTIQAVAAGQALTYQWFKGATLLPGQTADTLTIAPLQLSDAGTYKVQVGNPVGTNMSPDVTLTVLSIPTTSTNLNLTNALVVHLPFDNAYLDISGRSNNGTNVGTTTFVSPGAVGGNGLHYSSDKNTSTFNYVTLGVRSDLQFSSNVDFTVSFWVRQDVGSTYTNLPFFTDAVGSTSHGGFCFAPFAGTGGGGWMWTIGSVTSPNAATTFPDSNLINDGNWHHLAHVATRTATCVTYLDGTQVDSQSIDSALLGNINTAFAATIGQDPTGTYPVTANADIDDLGVWRRALTPLEVSGIYLAGVSNSVSFAPQQPNNVIVPASLKVQNVSGQVQISWTGTGGTLQASPVVTGTYTNIVGATSPYTVPGGSASQLFYRLQY